MFLIFIIVCINTFDLSGNTYILTSGVSRIKLFLAKMLAQLLILIIFILFYISAWIVLWSVARNRIIADEP
jgi:hypothetical protein